MWTGTQMETTHDPRLIDRLLQAGVLRSGPGGLETTPSWQEGMLRAFISRRAAPLHAWLEGSLTVHFPEADGAELARMARIMLHVEARETGVPV